MARDERPDRPDRPEPSDRDERNVLGGPLEECGSDPVTGFYRDGSCTCGLASASHLICVLATREFLAHQRSLGNDLTVPAPGFPGVNPGDRWCVVAVRWLHSHQEGFAAPVLLAATHERSLETVPLEVLRLYAADVPDDPSSLL